MTFLLKINARFFRLIEIFSIFAENIKNFYPNMSTDETYISTVASLLPEHDEDNENYEVSQTNKQRAQQMLSEKKQKLNAATLAKMKLAEKNRLKILEERKKNPTYGMTEKEKEKYENDKRIAEQNLAELEVIESSPEAQNFLAGSGHSDISPYAGTTKRDVVKMLDSLGINLNLYLTRTDTYNLLSCLLTCNESQLDALYTNPKVPLAIRTVIKRLKEDARIGNIETIEKLWDRIFGKAGQVQLQMPQTQQIPTTQGIIPNTVVSREAYMIIRDTIIGK